MSKNDERKMDESPVDDSMSQMEEEEGEDAEEDEESGQMGLEDASMRPFRNYRLRPLFKMSADLLNTYKHINEVSSTFTLH
jgi:hypothetical protein